MSKEEPTALDTAKAALKAAQKDHKTFYKENNLKEGKTPKDEKLAKKAGKLEKAITRAQAAVSATKKESRQPRESKYEYPSDCVTAGDKKKYRAKTRSGSKSKEKKKDKSKPKDVKKGKKKKKARAEVAAEESEESEEEEVNDED